MDFPIYLDNNATTRVDDRVLSAMLPYFTGKYGNAASRNHAFGWIAEEAVDLAREQVAQLLGATSREIVFTSGATEAINLALKGIFEAYKNKGNHIITCVTEHKAVLDTAKHIELLGGKVTFLPVKEDGLIDLQLLEDACTDPTILISVMHANNETGVIQPIAKIAEIAHAHGALFFSDATQAVGKIPLNVEQMGIDLLALSAHKMYGPKGAGALYVRRRNPRVKLIPQIDGGGHERGIRSGTLNVPGIVGFGKACELCLEEMKNESDRLSSLRDKLENALLASGDCSVNGSKTARLPHVTNLAFHGIDAETLIATMQNIAVSSGSACASASLEPSHVLKSMGRSDEMARSSIRFGLGRFTTNEEIEFAIQKVKQETHHLRSLSSTWKLHREGIR